jgi:hypothetical protein
VLSLPDLFRQSRACASSRKFLDHRDKPGDDTREVSPTLIN